MLMRWLQQLTCAVEWCNMQRIVNGHHEPGCTAGVSFYYNICVIYYVRWPICPLLSLCTFFFMCIPTLPSVLWRCWLGGRKGIRPVKNLVWWGTGMVICLERDADLHMALLMPLLLTVSCFSKIQIGFTFLVPAYPGGPGIRAVIWGCVCVFQHCLSYDASSNPSEIFFYTFTYRHCSHSMWVYETVGCLSVCLSHHSAATCRCSEFAAVGPAGRRCWLIAALLDSQQQLQALGRFIFHWDQSLKV